MTSVEKIKKLCKDRGISLHKLEMDLGYSNGYFAKLKKIPGDRQHAVARYFGVSFDSLLSDENEKAATETSDGNEFSHYGEWGELISIMKNLPEQKRSLVTALARSLAEGHTVQDANSKSE